MPHPSWVLAHRKKNTEIKKIAGYYYLYEVSSKWNAEKKRAVKISGACLGKITESGFVASKRFRESAQIKSSSSTVESSCEGSASSVSIDTPKIIIKESGASAFLEELGADFLLRLQQYFPEHWQGIWLCALFRLLYQAPFKKMDWHFKHSFLSEQYQTKALGNKRISAWLPQVGGDRENIRNFLKQFIVGEETLLIDMTHKPSFSNKNPFAQIGYNSQRSFDPQVNLLLLFSQDRKMPVYYRLLPGNIREIKAFKLTLKESGINDALLIGDKGFYSKENVEALEEAGLKYILPLRRNAKCIDYTPLEKNGKDAFEGYFKFEDRIIWYYTFEPKLEGLKENKDRKAVLFLDEKLKYQEQKDYIQRIENKQEGYCLEKFLQREKRMGTIVTLYNSKISPQKNYQALKTRNNIEQAFDTYKNTLEADKSYMQSENTMEAWTFINYIALTLYYRIYKKLKDKELINKYSPKDMLEILTKKRKIKIDDRWYEEEITKRDKDIIEHIT